MTDIDSIRGILKRAEFRYEEEPLEDGGIDLTIWAKDDQWSGDSGAILEFGPDGALREVTGWGET